MGTQAARQAATPPRLTGAARLMCAACPAKTAAIAAFLVLLSAAFLVACVPAASIVPEPDVAARPLADIQAAMRALAAEYPDHARIVTLGYGGSATSPGGDPSLPVLALEIESPAAKARVASGSIPLHVQLVGVFHGDEQIGAEVALDVAATILASAGTGSAAEALLDSASLTTIPVANPFAYGADLRTTLAGIDLNRCFPWPFGWESGSAPDRGYLGVPEARSLADDAVAKRYSMSVLLHSGSYCIAIPWDYIGTTEGGSSTYSLDEYRFRYAPAHPLFVANSAAYASRIESVAGSGSFPAIEGYDWYYVGGSYADWLYGALGCPGYTVELDPLKSWTSRVEEVGTAVIRRHRQALLELLAQAGKGAQGWVRNAAGIGIGARVEARPITAGSRALPAPLAYLAFGLTDASGAFRIALPQGSWRLVATAIGTLGLDSATTTAGPPSGSADIVVDAAGSSATVSLLLP
ncbi:MAG: M14 family zinc carboxypeptidase [Rectinemataceae bacterium]